MDDAEFSSEAVAKYWFTEAEETLAVADHGHAEYAAQQMMVVRETFEWLKSHPTS